MMAATKKWDGAAANGDWVTGLNWNPDNVPAPGDDILLDASFISIPASMVINGGVVNARTVTFEAGFNAASTTLIGNGNSFPSFLVLGSPGAVVNPLFKVNSTNGTITMDRRNGGTADLKVELGATSEFDVNSGATLIINCEIIGPHGITKTGGGILRLGGGNTYGGATTLTGGTLALVPSGLTNGSITGSPAITVGSGALFDVSGVAFTLQGGQTLAGSGTINGNVTAVSGSTLLAGPPGAAGTLTLSNDLSLAGAILVFDLASATTEGAGVNDEIVVSGNLALTGNNVIMLNYLNGSLPAGTYRILKYSGTKTGSFTLGAPYQNVTLDETTTPNYVTLVVGGSGSSVLNLTWQGDGGGNVWDLVTTATWLNGVSASGYFDPANVTINDSGSSTPSINLTTNVRPRSLTVNSIHNYTISGAGRIGSIPGLTNALIKSGSGTLTLETSNDFSGGVDIQAGTLRVGKLGAIPNGSGRGGVSVAGTLDLNAYSIAINGLAGTGVVDNLSGGGIYTLTMGSNNSGCSFSGVIRNTTGTLALSKIGSGTVALNGNNTFSGAVLVNDGVLRLSHSNALGSTAGSTTVSGGAALGRLELTGGITVNDNLVLAMKFGIGAGSKDPQVPHLQNISGDNIVNGSLTLNSGGTFWTFQSDAGKLTLTKGLSSAATGGRPLLLQGAGDGEIRGSIVNGSGQVALVKSGNGTWTLSGTNDYTQSTTINAGTLRVGSSNAIPRGVGRGDVAVDGTLDLNGKSITINGLSGSGTVDNGAGAGSSVFTVGDNNRSGTFSGIIRNTGGSVAVSKMGSGTLTLSGPNLHSGDTWVSQGTLKLGASNVIPDGSGKGNVVVDGTLDLAGNSDTLNGLSGSGTVDNSVGGSATLTVGNNDVSSTFSGVIGGSGLVSLAKLGGGTLTLNGNQTYTGNTTVSAGTLRINGSINSPSTVVNAGATLGGNGSMSGSLTVNVGGTLSPGISLGTLTISGALMLSGNAQMEISKAGVVLASDLVTGVNALTYGGTLTVTATGDPLAEGDTFNLFDAANFGGSFTSFSLPALPSCLVWDTSKLPVDGTIKVTRETVPPVISAAGASATIACPVVPVFTPPTATDNSAPAPTVVEVSDITTPGTCTGTYTRTKTWKAVDVCGNESGTVSQAITVVDLTPPTIVCAVAKTVECGSVWTFDSPTASDACGSASISIVSTITNTAGHLGNNFAATRTWRATDSCGNTTNCSQLVTVVDTISPVITCPTNLSVFTTNTAGTMVS